jgi:fructosamine-3-kinase
MLPYADAAARIGNLSARGRAVVDRVAERLRDGEFDDDRSPARIHGDLWAGNVIFTADGVVLIDPAAHGGHGLTDLAMLHLFGAPELSTISHAYADAAGLPADWPQLIGLHQLHPLLVHAVTHGPSYGAEAEAVAARYA